ncbi:MAG: LuxR C-terminal-related transcriptional regulator, partial [Dehalococcoidia bacterium]
ESCASYVDLSLRGKGPSTPSQTSWALLALLAALGKDTVCNPAIQGGIRYLVETQQEDGSWDEPYFTGTGFPGYGVGQRPTRLPEPGDKADHNGLGVGKVEWEVFVDLAAATLVQSGLDEREQENLFSLLSKTKAALSATKPAPSPLATFASYHHGLTDREHEVLRLVAMGMNNSEIADELFISVNTVTRHVTNIFTKTSTKNRVQAAVYAARRHMV